MNSKANLPLTLLHEVTTHSQTFSDTRHHDYHQPQISDEQYYPTLNMMNLYTDSTQSASSGLLFTLTTAQLALVVQYILENEESFARYQDKSHSIHAAFINYKIKGKMLWELTSHEFREELPWVRNMISAQIYDHLHTLSDHQIHDILSTKQLQAETPHIEQKQTAMNIILPDYLDTQIDIAEVAQIPFDEYTEHQFPIFVYVVLVVHKYEATLIQSLMRAILDSHLNANQFNALKRTDFCRALKPHDIKGAVASKLYKLIVSNKACNIAIIRPITEHDVMNELVSLGYGTKEEVMSASQLAVNPLDINDVLAVLETTHKTRTIHDDDDDKRKLKPFISQVLSAHKGYDEEVIASIVNALSDSQFVELKRAEFCRILKEHGVKGGVASKTYQLITSALPPHIDEHVKTETDARLEAGNCNTNTLHVLWNSTNSADEVRTNSNDSRNGNETVIDQLVSLGYGTRDECTKASKSSVNYWDINDVAESLKIMQQKEEDGAVTVAVTVAQLNEDEFCAFVRDLCVADRWKQNEMNCVMRAICLMDGAAFSSLSRMAFGRHAKEYGLKGGDASKLYKLITTTDPAGYLQQESGLLTASDISEIATADFQHSCYRMLKNMNESMKRNGVNGSTLMRSLSSGGSRHELQQYLAKNVRSKSVHIVSEMLWNDYLRSDDKKKMKIEAYDRKALLKYFIALFMYQVQTIIIRRKLNQNKCKSANRKALCTMFVTECGISIGAATNIVDKIFETIK
eukprot:645516_1